MSSEDPIGKEETPFYRDEGRKRSPRHPSSGTRGSISPQIRRELASVFDWMDKDEQDIEGAPLWFQIYMDTFKDEMVADVTSKVVQSLGVVLENKLAKLKISTLNTNQGANNQNRNKMTPKEVFQMKRRRNSRKFTTGPGQVPTKKEVISDKKPTNKSSELTHKKNADSKKSSNENLNKDDSTERSWAKEVEYDITYKDHVTAAAKANVFNKATLADAKEGVLVLSGNDNDERHNIDRKARPFLRQTRRNKSKNKAFITGFVKNSATKLNEAKADPMVQNDCKADTKEKVVTVISGVGGVDDSEEGGILQSSLQPRKSVKELTKQGGRSSRHWIHQQHQQERCGVRQQRRRLPAAKLTAMADSATSGDGRRESLTDPTNLLLSSLTKRRKSNTAISRHEHASNPAGSGITAANSGNQGPTGASAGTCTTPSRRTILTRRKKRSRRRIKMMTERAIANSCPASSGEDRQMDKIDIKDKERALVAKPNYPLTKQRDYPLIQTKNYPITPVKDYPVTAVRDYPVSPVNTYPVTSVKDYPVIPVKNYPVTPVKDYPVTPVKDYPVSPVRDYPVTPVRDYPVSPVREYPVTAFEDYPLIVVKDDILKDLLFRGNSCSSAAEVTAGRESSSGKDSGVNDDSVEEDETESTTSSSSSQFHTGCSGEGSSSEDNDIFEEDGYIPLLATTLKHPDTYVAGTKPCKYKPPPGRKPVKSSYESGMKLIPVAPSLEIADSVVLLKANYPVKRKDLLCLEYRVKAGTTCNLEIKVADIPAGKYKNLYLGLVQSDPQLLQLKQRESVLHKENLHAATSQKNLSVQAPCREGMYECIYRLQSKVTRDNDSLHLGVKYRFYVTKTMSPPKSIKELEDYLGEVRAVDGGGEGETELKDFVVSCEPEFEHAVEALETVGSGPASLEGVGSGPASLDKFDDLKEVCIGSTEEPDYEVLGFTTLDTQGDICAEYTSEAALMLAEEVLGVQEDQDLTTAGDGGLGQPLKLDLDFVPLGRSRSNSFDIVDVEEDCGPLSPFVTLEEEK